MDRPWVGRIFLGSEWALFLGVGGRTPLHQHLAAKWVVGLEGPVEIVNAEGIGRCGRLLTVDSAEVHQVLAEQTRVGLFIRDGGAFRSLPQLSDDEVKSFVSLCQRLDQGEIDALASIVGSRITDSHAGHSDPRMDQVVRQLSHSSSVSLATIARDVGLSHSRLTHLFSETLGGSPARYRRWRRLRVAAESLAKGSRIVDAALDAGFSDSAHLSRTFVEMLGITPGTFQGSQVHLVAPFI